MMSPEFAGELTALFVYYSQSFLEDKVPCRLGHLYNPEMSSEEAKAWTREVIAIFAEVLGNSVAILDMDRAQELLRVAAFPWVQS